MTDTNETERYLAICPEGIGGYFGKGATVDEAKANARKHGGRLSRYIVYRMPDGAQHVQVDDMGRVRWKWADPDADNPHSVELEVVAKRGVKEE